MHLRLRNQLSELDRLAEAVAGLALSAKQRHDVDLALEEVVSNVIRYAWPDEAEHWVDVTLEMDRGALVVRVEDDGVPFNPLDAPPPDLSLDLDERPIGGLGVFLAKRYMDKLSYERADGLNRLVMRKAL